jgi:hypothetical protein
MNLYVGLICSLTVWSYNTAGHCATGYSPYQVVFGIPPKEPNLEPSRFRECTQLSSLDDYVRFGCSVIRNKVRENILKARVGYKTQADKFVRRDAFNAGEKVLVRNVVGSHKFGNRFNGPYVVFKVINPTSVMLKDPVTNREFSANVDKCKKYNERESSDSNIPKGFDVVIVDNQIDRAVPAPRPCVNSNSRRPIQRDPYNMLKPRAGSASASTSK